MTFNTHHRARTLANHEIHHAFVDFCQRAKAFHVAVGRYVFMPDHVHLFVAMPETGEITLSRWVQSLKSVLGKQLLKTGVSKPHWQEGFFDHLLRHDESHAQKWEYVRLNPVRAGLCRVPEDWAYQGESWTCRDGALPPCPVSPSRRGHGDGAPWLQDRSPSVISRAPVGAARFPERSWSDLARFWQKL